MPTFEQIQDEIASMLSIPDEELDEEQRAAMDEYLNELGTQEAAKVDAFAGFLKIQTAMADACKEEAERLRAKAKTIESRISWLKWRYLEVMRANNLKKVAGKVYSLSIRKSEKAIVPDDESFLRALYESDPVYVRRKETYAADKAAIKEALKGGISLPGCELTESYSLLAR